MLTLTTRRLGRALTAPPSWPSSPAAAPPLLHRLFASGGTVAPSPTRLASVLRLDTLLGKSGDDVAAIWTAYHNGVGGTPGGGKAGKGRVGAVLPADEYALFAARARASPTFVLPLAKPGGGLITLVSQVQAPVTLVTTLQEFKAAGAAAPAHAVVTHYPDLVATKGVALVRGDVLGPHVVDAGDVAKILTMLHKAYVDAEGHAHVRAFNHAPGAFDYDRLLAWAGLERRE